MAVKPPRTIQPDFTLPRVMLAPVAGITDRTTRDIARAHGCPLTFSELISARGIYEQSKGSADMLRECSEENPMIVQIFGGEPDIVYDAVRRVEDTGVQGVNLNLGCPVKKVFKNKSGCGLTIFPTELVKVIRAMRQATNLHLSVKIRAGVNHRSLNYRLIGDIAQGEGCDAIIMHARTRMMGFGGIADWSWIADLKDYLDIPVIGNGDVADALSAKRMLDETGCDGVMIARASYGNPWIFGDVIHYLETGFEREPATAREKFDAMCLHIRTAVERKGERRALLELRKQLCWYVKGMPNIRPLREAINRLETLAEVIAAAREWYARLPFDPDRPHHAAHDRLAATA